MAGASTVWVKTDTTEQFNASVAAAGSAAVNVNTKGWSKLTVWWQLQSTTTTTDLASAAVRPARADGTTYSNQGLPTVRSVAAASDGTNVNQTNVYDVAGFDTVRISAQNNNAGAKTYVITTYLATG